MRIEKTRPPLEREAKQVVPQTKTGPSEGRRCSELPRVREMTQRSTDKMPVPSSMGHRESEKAGEGRSVLQQGSKVHLGDDGTREDGWQRGQSLSEMANLK